MKTCAITHEQYLNFSRELSVDLPPWGDGSVFHEFNPWEGKPVVGSEPMFLLAMPNGFHFLCACANFTAEELQNGSLRGFPIQERILQLCAQKTPEVEL